MPFSSSLEIYRNTRYFRHFKFCRKVRFLPFPGNFPSKKRILFRLIRIPLAFTILPKENSLFRGEIPWKGEKPHFPTKFKMAEIPCITVDFKTGWKGHYSIIIFFWVHPSSLIHFSLWSLRKWNLTRKRNFRNYLFWGKTKSRVTFIPWLLDYHLNSHCVVVVSDYILNYIANFA